MRRSRIYRKLHVLSSLHRTVGRGQRPPACRVRHSSKVTEKPHGNGQVHEPAGELEPGPAGEEPCHRWRKGPVGEGGPDDSKHPRLGEEELQPGVWGDQGASRWRKKRNSVFGGNSIGFLSESKKKMERVEMGWKNGWRGGHLILFPESNTMLFVVPFSARMAGLQEDNKSLKLSLSKVEAERKQAQERSNNLEKVDRKSLMVLTGFGHVPKSTPGSCCSS